MAWDFETDPEFQEKLDWADDVRARGGRAARPASARTCSSRRSTTERRTVIDPLKEQVRDQGLWATHLGPELGGQGYGQLKLALLNEILGRSQLGADHLRLPGARHRQRRDHRPLRHRPSRRRSYLQPLLDGEIFSCYSMTEPHAGADPTLFTTRAVQGRRRVGHQRLEVLLVERQHRVVPHRDGGDRPRRQRVPGHVDVPGARPTRPGVKIVRNVGLGGEPRGRGLARPHPLRRRAGARPTPCSAARARPSPSPRPASAAVASTTPCAPSACRQKALDMMCERALSRETAGQPARRQAVRAGLHRRLLRPAHAVPAVRALHRVGDRQVQRLQARSARTSPRSRS